MGPPERKPVLVEGVGIPRRIMQEVVELLPIPAGHQGGEDRHRLVVLPRQEQADQVVAEGLPSGAAIKEIIELSAEGIDGIRGGNGRLARRCHGASPEVGSRTDEQMAAASLTPPPNLTNQR